MPQLALTDIQCKQLASKIRENVFKPAFTYKTSVFLCGADINRHDMLRYKVAQYLTLARMAKVYDVIYPEDIFDELLYNAGRYDLLSLENLLADSVDAIIIILESPGSFTELGAFANSTNLVSKIICVIDEKYKKDKSFINNGPVKLVKKANPNGVVYIKSLKVKKLTTDYTDLQKLFFDDPEIDKIVAALRKIKKKSTKEGDKINLLQLENFILPSIFLLEPVSKTDLRKLVSYAIEDGRYSYHATTTALSMLTKKKKIQAAPEGYQLTDLGIKDFYSFHKSKSRDKSATEAAYMDFLRLEILNLKYRGKKMKV